jgi:hypothetical protein
MEVNDGKGLGRLIVFCPQRVDNRVLEAKFLIYVFFALIFGIIGLKRRLLLAFMAFGESGLYRDFANPKGYSQSFQKGEKDENGKRRS